jgi:hypothetical protein
MQQKIKAFGLSHRGRQQVEKEIAAHRFDRGFDYGNLARVPCFTGTHPAVMKEWIARFDWREQLRFSGPAGSLNPVKSKHDRLKYRIMSWIEKRVLGGRRLGEFRNYHILKR